MTLAMSTTLRTTFDDAGARTREALSDQGFGVLTEIDVTATLKAKLDEEGHPDLTDRRRRIHIRRVTESPCTPSAVAPGSCLCAGGYPGHRRRHRHRQASAPVGGPDRLRRRDGRRRGADVARSGRHWHGLHRRGLWHQLAAVRHALHTRRMLVGLLTGLFGVAHTGDAGINGLTLIDVRQTSEYGDSHIPGALNIPLHELAERIAEVPANEVWVHCGSGYRASIAASILDRSHHDVVLIDDTFDNAKSNDLASDTWTRTGICGQLLDASRQPSHLCA